MSLNLRDDERFDKDKDSEAYSSKSPPDLKMILSSSQGLAIINPTLVAEQQIANKEGRAKFHSSGYVPGSSSEVRRHFFPLEKLPPKLRHEIWKHVAAETRVVVVSFSKIAKKPWLQSKTSPPAILHTCQESRAISLTFLKKLIINKIFLRTYVNWELDIIYMGHSEFKKVLSNLKETTLFSKSNVQMCRRLAIDSPKISGNVEKVCVRFPKLEELINVDLRNDSYLLSNANRKILSFRDFVPQDPDGRKKIDDRLLSLMSDNPGLKRAYQEPIRQWSAQSGPQKTWLKAQKGREARCDAVMLAAYKLQTREDQILRLFGLCEGN